jgi:hypothetical protein
MAPRCRERAPSTTSDSAVAECPRGVRSTPNFGHSLARVARQKSANSGREQVQQHRMRRSQAYSITSSARASATATRARRDAGLSSSRAQLGCKLNQVLRYHINRLVRGPNSFGLAMLATRRPAFFAPMISPVCAAAETIMHSPGGRSNIQQRRDRLVVLAVVASNLGAENGIEAKLVAPSEIGHQRDVGIGNWRQEEIIGQASKPPALRPVTHPADARQGLSSSPRLQSNP